MPASRDDFGIAFRSALLQKGAAQKFSVFSLLIIAILIFFLDIYNISFMKPIRSFINDGIYRISMVASAPSRILPNLFKSTSNLFVIKDENKKLREQIEVYKLKEFNVEYLTNQNKILKQFLETGVDADIVSEDIIIAKVMLDKDSPYIKSIIINKGTKAGVIKGMPVLNDNYLVGRVVETNYLSSRVLLLDDLNSRIPVTLDNNGTQAILKGNGGNEPTLEYLPDDYIVESEINVFTSGKDQIYTAGVPIGKTNAKGTVSLFTDSYQLSFVKIDLNKKIKETF